MDPSADTYRMNIEKRRMRRRDIWERKGRENRSEEEKRKGMEDRSEEEESIV